MKLKTIKNLEKILGTVALGGLLTLVVLCSQKAEGEYMTAALTFTAVTTVGYTGMNMYITRKEES